MTVSMKQPDTDPTYASSRIERFVTLSTKARSKMQKCSSTYLHYFNRKTGTNRTIATSKMELFPTVDLPNVTKSSIFDSDSRQITNLDPH